MTRVVDDTGTIAVERRGPAIAITIARPARANAYTQPMLHALREAIECADADRSVRVLVVRGQGDRAFCAGADRNELATRDWDSVLSLTSAHVFRRLQTSRCVTIAAINGPAVGGGFELALSCDFRIAVASARFWLPETAMGLLPAAGATRLLPALVGPARARELVLAGIEWSASDAFAAGCLTEVVNDGELDERVGAWIERIASRDAEALRLAKQALDAASPAGAEPGIELVAQCLLVAAQRAAAGTNHPSKG